MYIAEIKGKIPSEFEHREDVLTSDVFSFYKYSDRVIFLGPFLEMLGVSARLFPGSFSITRYGGIRCRKSESRLTLKPEIKGLIA